MAGTSFDVIIGGTKAKILHGDQAGYRRRSVRQQVEQQLISQAETSVLSSRLDRIKLYQTSWAGGSRWWKPLLNPNQVDNYHTSTGLDLWSRPGHIVPANKFTQAAANTIVYAPIASDSSYNLYAISRSSDDDATQRDVAKWSGTAWVDQTGYSSGASNPSFINDLIYDPNDSKFYNHSNDGFINRFEVGVGEDKDWINTGITAGIAKFALSPHGLFFFDGDQIYEVVKGTPAITSRVNDGMGDTGVAIIGTSEGMYYAKNVVDKGVIRGWIFRIDKDATGSYITEPIATLPAGSEISDLYHHLGSVIVSAKTGKEGALIASSGIEAEEMVFYSIDEQTGLSVLGSPQSDDALVDTIGSFLGAQGSLLYIGGHESIWVYDGARGGIHKLHGGLSDAETPYTYGGFRRASGELQLVMNAHYPDGPGTFTNSFKLTGSDPDTVTGFGDDETFYTLESNYFDGGLPMELKELTKVEIIRDAGNGSQEWTVQVSADDGAFADVLVHSASGTTYATATLTGTKGRRFRYKLIYQTKTAVNNPLRALMFTMSTGELITEWDLMLDGAQLLNVDNELQDEQVFFDSMVTLSANESIITLIDNMQEQEQLTSDGDSGTKVTVQVIEIIKDKAGESAIRVVLRAVV